MYDLDELDLNWLESVNTKRKFRGMIMFKVCAGKASLILVCVTPEQLLLDQRAWKSQHCKKLF